MKSVSGKTITLRIMKQKEMRALWRKYEPAPESKEKAYVYDEEAVDELYEKSVAREETNPVAGIFTKTDEVVGMISFDRLVVSEKRCELTLILANESYRGKGFGTEAVMLAKQVAKDQLGVTKIYADVSSKNLRMQAVLKKCGFLHTKTFKGNYADGGDRMTFFAMV